MSDEFKFCPDCGQPIEITKRYKCSGCGKSWKDENDRQDIAVAIGVVMGALVGAAMVVIAMLI